MLSSSHTACLLTSARWPHYYFGTSTTTTSRWPTPIPLYFLSTTSGTAPQRCQHWWRNTDRQLRCEAALRYYYLCSPPHIIVFFFIMYIVLLPTTGYVVLLSRFSTNLFYYMHNYYYLLVTFFVYLRWPHFFGTSTSRWPVPLS